MLLNGPNSEAPQPPVSRVYPPLLGRAPGPCGDFRASTLDSQKLEYGFRVALAGCPSVLGFGVRRQPNANFLALP